MALPPPDPGSTALALPYSATYAAAKSYVPGAGFGPSRYVPTPLSLPLTRRLMAPS